MYHKVLVILDIGMFHPISNWVILGLALLHRLLFIQHSLSQCWTKLISQVLESHQHMFAPEPRLPGASALNIERAGMPILIALNVILKQCGQEVFASAAIQNNDTGMYP